jgi:hypothetical protein
MALTLILAAFLASAPVPGQPDRSLSDSDRLSELDIAIRSARAGGEIDGVTAERLHLGVARARRQMFRMGMQVGYRQKVQLRERIDGLYERLAAHRTATGRSGK